MTEEIAKSWVSVVSQVVFPIIVCGWLLYERKTGYKKMETSFRYLAGKIHLLLAELHFSRTGRLLPDDEETPRTK